MSRYEKNSISKAQEIINNLSDGIPHSDPDLNEKLMNYTYNKDGCFFLKIEIIDLQCKSEIVGDAAVGLPAIANILGHTLNNSPDPEGALEVFLKMIKKSMEDDK